VTITARQTLLIDADDTLWENNIYFERAIGAFIDLLNHRHFDREQVREYLNQAERESIASMGYGLHSFEHALAICFERLSDHPLTDEKHEQIREFSRAIANEEIVFMPGVEATLPLLAARHRLILVTKGRELEQADKIERSGLRPLFDAVEIVHEKDEPTYREIVQRHVLDPRSTWMVGNSPRSDVNPALAAGLNVAHLPHAFTWPLEVTDIAPVPPGQQLVTLRAFTDLIPLFVVDAKSECASGSAQLSA
jgi:putative hydrolase of the HAD superfamily